MTMYVMIVPGVMPAKVTLVRMEQGKAEIVSSWTVAHNDKQEFGLLPGYELRIEEMPATPSSVAAN